MRFGLILSKSPFRIFSTFVRSVLIHSVVRKNILTLKAATVRVVMSSLRAITAAWLNVLQRNQGGDLFSRFAQKESVQNDHQMFHHNIVINIHKHSYTGISLHYQSRAYQDLKHRQIKVS